MGHGLIKSFGYLSFLSEIIISLQGEVGGLLSGSAMYQQSLTSWLLLRPHVVFPGSFHHNSVSLRMSEIFRSIVHARHS